MKSRVTRLACFSVAFIAAGVLTLASSASAWRRMPALTCVPFNTTALSIGTGAAWTNTSSSSAALYCPYWEGLKHSDGWYSYDSLKTTVNGAYADFVVHSTGSVPSCVYLCVTDYNAATTVCGNSGCTNSSSTGWQSVSVDDTEWTNDDGNNYAYAYVSLAPSYAEQLQGIYFTESGQ
jgi:hypothetical protein